MAYNVPLADLLKLNNFTLKSVIYINQKIIIRGTYTATPTLPTGTPTIRPTLTEWPTIAPTITVISSSPTPTPSPVLPITSAKWAVASIVIIAIVIAGAIALFGARKK
jgi:LysM repeat protein